jgi:serine/threonine-protein kinase RsbT
VKTAEQELFGVLGEYVGGIMARAILSAAALRSQVDLGQPLARGDQRLLRELDRDVRVFIRDADSKRACVERLRRLFDDSRGDALAIDSQRLEIAINSEDDVVTARCAVRDLCGSMGFGASVQIRVATAVSELTRNVAMYAGQGTMVAAAITRPRRGVEVVVRDHGPGIPNIEDILAGRYRSRTGMGIGIKATRQLADEFEIDTGPGKGTTVKLRKFLT